MALSSRGKRYLVVALLSAVPLVLLILLLAVAGANEKLAKYHLAELAIALSAVLLALLGLVALRARRHTGGQRTVPLTEARTEVFDEASALDRLGGDRELLRELIDVLLAEYPKHLAEVREAVARSDAGQLQRAAHKLKGSLATFSAKAAAAAALQLEGMGRSGDLAGAAAACAALETELDVLQQTLTAWMRQGPQSAP